MTLILIGVALFVVALPALIGFCLCAAAGDADRVIEQSRPEGSPQARVDQARRDALNTVGEVADTVWPDGPGIRHTPGGWRAS